MLALVVMVLLLLSIADAAALLSAAVATLLEADTAPCRAALGSVVAVGVGLWHAAYAEGVSPSCSM